jgi:hypothetical protein
MQRAGALILVVLGVAIGWIAANKTKVNWRSPAGAQIVAVSASLPLAHYLLWMSVPGYNWIVLVGGMVLLIAMLLLSEVTSSFYSAAMAAVAAILVVLTRPQNATGYAALYLAVIFLMMPSNKDRLVQIVRTACLTALAIACAAAVLPLATIESQIQAFIAIFGTGHPVRFSYIDQQLEFLREAWLWFVCGAILAFALFSRLGGKPLSSRVAVLICTVAPIVLAITLVRIMLRLDAYRIGPATGILAFCALSLACLRKDADIRLIALLGVAALIPWAATLGASGSIRPQLVYYSGISSFIAVVGLALAARGNLVAVSVASCIGLYITFSAVEVGLVSPYRLGAPIAMQVVPTQMGWGSKLKLDSETSRFVESVRTTAASGGFCQGDPAIDFSGAMPGVVFVMGGRMPVFPWIFSGYPFSDRFLDQYLKRLESGTLYRSWLILNENTNNFSRQQIESHGVDFNRFRLAVDLRHPVDGSSVKIYAPLLANGPCVAAS